MIQIDVNIQQSKGHLEICPSCRRKYSFDIKAPKKKCFTCDMCKEFYSTYTGWTEVK